MIDIGFGIAGLIIAFIVFAELHSIRAILGRREQVRDDRQELSDEIRSLKRISEQQGEAIKDLIGIIEEANVPLSAYGKSIIKHAKTQAAETAK
ncbi:MAG: hypothetical protein NC217_00155 [Muribaculaceae bacterium]|nr:hypothetical protein [Muribaculaceae bacterium]